MKHQVKRGDDIIISNCNSLIKTEYTRHFEYGNHMYSIHLETEIMDEKKSPRLRSTYFQILEETTKNFLRNQQDAFNKYNHIIQTISTQISQKIDGYFGEERWYSNNYNEALSNIGKYLLDRKAETGELIHYFNKMSIDLKSHIEGWDIIYIKESYMPKSTEVSLKKAILNQLSSFAEEFADLGIKIKFSEDFLETYTVSLDKKLFSLIMYNFFSNALKYSKPNEVIGFNYFNESGLLEISMYSVKIERNEIEELFNDGIRGAHANKVSSSGNGSGLYVIKKALRLMNMPNMYINPDYTKTNNVNDIPYCKNHFKFELR